MVAAQQLGRKWIGIAVKEKASEGARRDGEEAGQCKSPHFRFHVRKNMPQTFKVVLNRSKVLNLTCFHGFRPNLFGRRYLERLFLYLLSETGREIISLSMRKYGDSLDKFEPNDLNVALAPSPDFFSSMPAAKVFEAVKAVVETQQLPQWVEDFFAPLKISGADFRAR